MQAVVVAEALTDATARDAACQYVITKLDPLQKASGRGRVLRSDLSGRVLRSAAALPSSSRRAVPACRELRVRREGGGDKLEFLKFWEPSARGLQECLPPGM